MRSRRLVVLIAAVSLCLSAVVRAQGAKPAHETGAATDFLLDGNDWRMGSFEFDAGLKAGADKDNFDDSSFKAVTVPGDTQLQAGFKGVDRWFETKDLIAINQKEWWYRKHFGAGPKIAGTVTQIAFDGADYFVTVWLNGRLLGTHEGTYTAFAFDVTDKLRYGADNVLSVVVSHPWVPKGRGLLEYMNGDFSMAYTLPGGPAQLDKPPYFIDVAWDALPAQGNAAFDMGIWRSVHLRTTSLVTIDDVHVETQSIDPDGRATLQLGATLKNVGQETATRTVSFKLSPDNFTGSRQDLPPLNFTAAPGLTEAKVTIHVPHAQLWWSWDHGPQNLYKLVAVIAPTQGQWGDQRAVTFGIRTITRDSNMAYWLNGKKIFIKASWFAIEDFYRSTPTAESYDRDLRLYRDGNFNLVVNFTAVEKPEFYDLCDRLGILVVAELPFPQFGPLHIIDRGGPRREPYMQQARLQVSEIITALRNHVSIIEWAPLAEAHEKAGEWSMGVDQQSYDDFMSQMKSIITELAPGSIFHPSLCDLGEQHFWTAAAGMIWQKEPYQLLFDAKTSFVSEYGGISLSSYENLGKYLTPAQQWDGVPNQPRWFNLPIDTAAYSYLTSFDEGGLYSMLYRTEHWVDRNPRSLPELVSDTQLYQGLILNYAAQAFRRKKYDPISGIRSWNFLELGPGFRFGIVDYDRVPKISYSLLKRSQAPVALSFAYKDVLDSQLAGSQWSAPVWLINDLDKEIKGTVHAELVAPNGEKIAATDFPATIPADGKGSVGDFSLTLPKAAGVYILRATLTGSHSATETSFIKVVKPAFAAPHRVLLIAQAKTAAPIANLLRSIGLTVDVYDEDALDEIAGDLTDGNALHAKYDAIWVGCFEALVKVLPQQSAKAIADAVKAGSGFIITGGEGSFHGGLGRAAVVEGTALNQILPVGISGHPDLIYGPHGMDDALSTNNAIDEIAPGSDATENGVSPEGYALLHHYGLTAFNAVTARAGAHVELIITKRPLLVTGVYGAGRTAAFTGYTPVADQSSAQPADDYMIAEPRTRAYLVLFADLLADVMPGTPRRTPDLLAEREKPLFQLLKEQLKTGLVVTVIQLANATVDGGFRSRVRIVNTGGYAHLVHMRFTWPQAGPAPYLAELSDNDFEMLPNETREIDLTWRTSNEKTATGTLIVNAANAPAVSLAF
jgi:beta-mannosidase